MQPIDYDIRNKILDEKNNIAISASAGTGKTYTTVLKIEKEVSEHDHYSTFAAITFTRKAAKEIENRLGDKKGNGFVGTNDNFVLREIIQPFMYDVYGSEFKKDIIPDYSEQNAFKSFEDGIEVIREHGYLCKYKNNNYINFAFQLALDILKKSKAARRYISSKYYRIYIDEYQDSDKDMHNLFMYICKNLEVPLFIVGDAKQSIYGWRGGYVQGFKDILNETNYFSVFKLKHNFRSNIPIQNYSNLFMDDVRENYQICDFNGEVQLFKYNSKEEVVQGVESWLDNSLNCAILVRRNDEAEDLSNLLNEYGINFTYLPGSPLDNTVLESQHIWISRILAFYILQERFSEYDVVSEIPSSDSFDYKTIKKLLKSISDNNEEYIKFEDSCNELYNYLGYEACDKVENEIKVLYEAITNCKYVPTYNQRKYKNVITTIHSSKGLQYEQVIIFGCDYNLSREDDQYLHYVAISRPERRLLIMNDDSYNGSNYSDVINLNVKKLNQLKNISSIKRNDVIRDI